jgi:hypothetical protein
MLYNVNVLKYQSFLDLPVCPICFEALHIGIHAHGVAITGCGHRFHHQCLKAHQETSAGTCPACRTWIGRPSASYNELYLANIGVDMEQLALGSGETGKHEDWCDSTLDGTAKTPAMITGEQSVAVAIDKIYGDVACIFQLRMSHECRDTSAEAEAVFMAAHFIPLVLEMSTLRYHLNLYASRIREVSEFERRVLSGRDVRWGIAEKNAKVESEARDMLRLCTEVRQVEFMAVIHVFEKIGDLQDWNRFIEAKMKESYQQVTCILHENALRNPSYKRIMGVECADLDNRQIRDAADAALCADVLRGLS